MFERWGGRILFWWGEGSGVEWAARVCGWEKVLEGMLGDAWAGASGPVWVDGFAVLGSFQQLPKPVASIVWMLLLYRGRD